MVTLRILVHPKRTKTNIFRLIRHENVPAIEELFTAIMPLIAIQSKILSVVLLWFKPETKLRIMFQINPKT